MTPQGLQTWKRLTPKNDSHKPETAIEDGAKVIFDYSSLNQTS
jgi:hypothetical protein